MISTKIVRAEQHKEFFYMAEDFLKPKEKYFCTLMERIQNAEDSVFVIVQKFLPSYRRKVAGVFSYTKGKTFTAYIPVYTRRICSLLLKFLKENEIFCLVGRKFDVEMIEKLVKKARNLFPSEERPMFLMEYCEENNEFFNSDDFCQQKFETSLENNLQIKQCSFEDAETLFPLHVAYCKEEVLPSWKKINLSAERLSLEHNLRSRYVLGIFDSLHKKILSKAQTNAETLKTVQIGGVFTLETHRKKGFAGTLVKNIACKFKNEGKSVVLFVRQNNFTAVNAYKKVGFKYFGEYKMDYYL